MSDRAVGYLVARATDEGITCGINPRGDIVVNTTRDAWLVERLAESLGWQRNGSGFANGCGHLFIITAEQEARRKESADRRSRPFRAWTA